MEGNSMTDFMSTNPEDIVLLKLTEAALQGSAAQMAMRHDLKAEKIAAHAVEIAKAAIEELKKT